MPGPGPVLEEEGGTEIETGASKGSREPFGPETRLRPVLEKEEKTEMEAGTKIGSKDPRKRTVPLG